jgi:peptidoglycan/xylan/chitin deacetylase (PgdA/CDA1 family)
MEYRELRSARGPEQREPACREPCAGKRLPMIRVLCLATAVSLCGASFSGDRTPVRVPVLVYHRLGPVRLDSMTVTTPVFQEQMRWIQNRGYHVVSLRKLVDYVCGSGPAPDPKSVVLTADDGHSSIFRDMYPVVGVYNFQVTLFVYPSAISNAAWAMTWEELQTLEDSGLFDVQSHTYWHPNFRKEKERRSPADFTKFVDWQLVHSKKVLEEKLDRPVDLLAWPFGIYTPWLMNEAAQCGYRAAFSIERRPVNRSDSRMALPRIMVADTDRGARFEALLSE